MRAHQLGQLAATLALVSFVSLASLAVSTGTARGQTDAARKRPNIVLVMTDDQGYGDFGCQGNSVLDTPAVDAFAAQCPTVERFYVSPVCSPTRACLMTGRYNYRTRVVDTWIGRSMMEPDELTIAEALGSAGYTTGIFGKWHLGDCYPMRPIDQGFDEALVHRGGGLAQPSEPLENRRRYTDPLLVHNGELQQTKGYCTDVYFDGALAFIDRAIAADQPFFTYIATNAPHGPFHDVPPALLAKYKSRNLTAATAGKRPQLDKLARIFAMIENVDQNFARLLAHLEEREIADNTIVVFLCDNGPNGVRYTKGLRGQKSSVYEGGIRSPLWIRWPGHLKPATRVHHPAAHIDLMPTLCDAAGVRLPPATKLDGRSLLPQLQGRDADWQPRRLTLQTHRGDAPAAEHHFAVIGPRWKLVRHSGFGRTEAKPSAPFELFDLQADPGEARDLARQHPEVVAALRAHYRTWFEDVSTTRPNNFAPPRIHIGNASELVTALTRQDWRPADGVGWGHAGAWLLHVEQPGDYRVQLRFQQQERITKVRIETRGPPIELQGPFESDRIDIPRVAFPGGDVSLRVTCSTDDEKIAPYHILIHQRPR